MSILLVIHVGVLSEISTLQVQIANFTAINFSPHRDGSAVELQGLCYSAVNWLAKLHQKGIYPHSGVRTISEALGKTIAFLKYLFYPKMPPVSLLKQTKILCG